MNGGPGSGIARRLPILFAAWSMLWLAYFLPAVRLDAAFSVWLVWLTQTAGVTGATSVAVALAGLLAFRAPLSWRRILRELLVHAGVLALLLGGGALVNEYLVKESLATHRPNIVTLAKADSLGMTAEQFYSSMDKGERRRYLSQVLEAPSFDAIPLSAKVRDHWIHETGYSLPSGHTFTAMLLAAYFFAMATTFAGKRRRWVFSLLPCWAVLVAGSRVLLGVHRPEDVVWGGLLGVSFGVIAAWLSRRLLCRHKIPT